MEIVVVTVTLIVVHAPDHAGLPRTLTISFVTSDGVINCLHECQGYKQLRTYVQIMSHNCLISQVIMGLKELEEMPNFEKI
jgi:hypothetical protein